MRRGLILIAALAVAGLGCSDDDNGTGGSGGSTGGTGGVGATGGTGGGGGDAGSGGGMAQAVSIAFEARIGDEVFECGQSYTLGSTDTLLLIDDFRFYVHDVELRNAGGDWVAVELDDTIFQADGVALLDFEDCGELGNEDINGSVTGMVPADNYDGVRFTMGLPFDLNHANPGTAPSPLNLFPMHWAWNSGYKFLRIDSGDPSSGGWRMHLGSTGCDGDPVSGGTTGCTATNSVPVLLEGFDLDSDVIFADLQALVEGQDLGDLAPMPPGCMSGPRDTDCTSIFANLGLPFEETPGGEQQFFRIE